MTQHGGETGIPILTEVIEAPVYGVDTPERRAWPRPAPAPSEPSEPSAAQAFTASEDPGTTAAGGQADRVPAPVAATALITQEFAADRIDASDAAAMERIAASVRTQVLQPLLDHMDATLEQRIRDSLAQTLELAITQLTAQLRQGVQEVLETLLTEAIARELADRQISKI